MKPVHFAKRWAGITIVIAMMRAAMHAQTPAPLPSGPLLNRAPQDTKWEITFQYGSEPPCHGDSAQPGKAIGMDIRKLKITVTKTPALVYEEVLTIGGNLTRHWRKGNLEVVQVGKSGPFVIIDSLDDKNALRSSNQKTDFPDFGWISASNYRGTKTLPSGECLAFSDEVPELPDAGLSPELFPLPKSPPATTTALINAKTRLPVLWKRGDVTQTYHFSPASRVPEVPMEAQYLFALNQAAPAPGRPLRP